MFLNVSEWFVCGVAAAQAMVAPLGAADVNEKTLWRIGAFYAFLFLAGVVTHAVLFLRMQVRPPQWERRVAAFENTPWQPGEALRILLFLMALYFAVSLTKRAFSLPEQEKSVWVILQSASFHLAGIAFVAHAMRRQRLDWRRAFGISSERLIADAGRGGVLYLAMMPIVIFYSLIYQWFLRYIGYRVSPQDVIVLFVSEESVWGRLYTFLLAGLIAPVFEELIFRGVALPVMARHRSTMWAMLVLAAAFAMIHFHIPSLVPLFLVAMALSIGYVYTRSLTVPIVAHGLFNLVNLTVLTLLRIGS